VLEGDAVRHLCLRAREIYLDDRIRDYIVALVSATRRPRASAVPRCAPASRGSRGCGHHQRADEYQR